MNSLSEAAAAAGKSVGLTSDTITFTGGRPLNGRIVVRGAKNFVTKAWSPHCSVIRQAPCATFPIFRMCAWFRVCLARTAS